MRVTTKDGRGMIRGSFVTFLPYPYPPYLRSLFLYTCSSLLVLPTQVLATIFHLQSPKSFKWSFFSSNTSRLQVKLISQPTSVLSSHHPPHHTNTVRST